MSILNDAWVVGIGGGVLSGLFVAFVTRYIFSKRDNKEYAQKIDSVNQEVIYVLRPGIAEGRIPSEEVLNSLLNATARRHKVSRKDIYTPQQIAEELIKDIMESSFISSDTKQKYCETLAHLILPPPPANDLRGSGTDAEPIARDYRNRLASRMSAILGVTATAMVAMMTGFTALLPRSSIFNSLINVAAPTLIVIFATVLVTAFMLTSRLLQKHNSADRRSNIASKAPDSEETHK